METIIGKNITHNFHATRSKAWEIRDWKNYEKRKDDGKE
jgi:hypothetical protein